LKAVAGRVSVAEFVAPATGTEQRREWFVAETLAESLRSCERLPVSRVKACSAPGTVGFSRKLAAGGAVAVVVSRDSLLSWWYAPFWPPWRRGRATPSKAAVQEWQELLEALDRRLRTEVGARNVTWDLE
jgi:hypothetical protein